VLPERRASHPRKTKRANIPIKIHTIIARTSPACAAVQTKIRLETKEIDKRLDKKIENEYFDFFLFNYKNRLNDEK
jgi:hypothetical protein